MAGRGTSTSGKGDYRVKFVVDPSPLAMAKVIGGLGKEFSDWRPAWRRLVPHLAAGIRQNIDSRGSTLSRPWPATHPRYAQRKARRGFGRIDLVLSGKLVAEATSPNSVVSMTPRRVSFGTQLPYARAVQFGKGKKSGRSFMGWNSRMLQHAREIMNDHAATLIARASDRISRLSEVA